jgi:hypothetical protein
VSRAFAVTLIAALATVTLWWQLSERRARALDRDLVRATAIADSIARLDRTLDRPATARRDSESEIAGLRRRGVANPAQAIREALARHPELVPFKGVQGGRMFFDTTNVTLLRGGWVYAGFEDGHVGGYAILETQVEGDGVRLKPLAAFVDAEGPPWTGRNRWP